MRQWASSIAGRILLYSAAVFILLAVALSAVHLITYYMYLSEDARGEAVNMAHNRAVAVEEFVARTGDVARQVTSRTRAWQALEEYLDGKLPAEELTSFTTSVLGDALEKARDLAGITRLDASGKVVGIVGEPMPPRFLASPPQVEQGPFHSEPFRENGKDYLLVAARITDREDHFLGTDLLLFHLAPLLDILAKTPEASLARSSVLAVPEDGHMRIIAPLEERDGEMADLLSAHPVGQRISEELRDPDEERAHHFLRDEGAFAFWRVPGRDWCVVSRLDEASLFGPVWNAVMLQAAVAAVLIALSVLGLWLLLRPLAGKVVFRVGEMEERIREATAHLEREIAEHARAEESLRRLKMAVEQSVDGVLIIDMAEKVLFANPSWATMHGYEAAEDLRGLPISAFHTPEQFERQVKPFAEIVSIRGWHRAEIGHVRRDGTTFTTLLTCSQVTGESGEVVALVGVAHDISERKRAERQVRRELRFREALLDAIPNPVFYKDGEQRYVGCNRAFERYMGVTEQEIAGKAVHEVWPEPYADMYKEQDEKLLDSDSVQVYEGRLPTADGEEREVLFSKAAYRDESGTVAGMIGVIQDVTELVASKRAAEAANLAKSEFLANMSHEIRTPMNGILGMLELLQETELSPRQREYADTVMASARVLLEILNDILDLSRIEAGELRLRSAPFDLGLLVEEVGAFFAPRAVQKGLDLHIRVAPDCPLHFAGDSGRLRQVLNNLVGNALKFTERGYVLIDVDCDRQDDDEASMLIEVEDTGIGIPVEMQGQVFEAFAQADTSSTRNFEGTGLGLAICRKIMMAMGGMICLDSQPGRGTSFTLRLTLPKVREPDKAADDKAWMEALRVLVVDDNPINRRILLEFLGFRGIECEAVASVREGMACLASALDEGRPFGVAIIDYHMPDEDGLILARWIAEEERLSKTRTILCSSNDMVGDDPRLREAGVMAVLNKPIRFSHLLRCLRVLADPEASPKDLARLRLTPEAFDGAAGQTPRFGLRVLLAEDNPVNQRVAAEILTRYGCTTAPVGNGQEALERLARESFDLVLLDCSMPVMDGYETARAIRAREGEGARLPVVALTARAMEGDRERCLEAGMDDYLAKPVGPAAVLEMLAKWFPERARAGAGAVAPAEDSGGADAELDPGQLRRMADGDAALIRQVIEIFQEDFRMRQGELRAAAEGGDAEAVRSAAHAMAGSALNVGGRRLATSLKAIEREALEGRLPGDADLDEIAALFASLAEQLGRTEWA